MPLRSNEFWAGLPCDGDAVRKLIRKVYACEMFPSVGTYECRYCGVRRGSTSPRRCNNQMPSEGRQSPVPCSKTAVPKATSPRTAACQHFLGPTGEQTETHRHCGCKTATGMTALADCELHGVCTFVGRAKDEAIPFCQTCDDYSAAEAEQSA